MPQLSQRELRDLEARGDAAIRSGKSRVRAYAPGLTRTRRPNVAPIDTLALERKGNAAVAAGKAKVSPNVVAATTRPAPPEEKDARKVTVGRVTVKHPHR